MLDRGARSVVKLFNIEDTETWSQDMDEVGKLDSDDMEESVNSSLGLGVF